MFIADAYDFIIISYLDYKLNRCAFVNFLIPKIVIVTYVIYYTRCKYYSLN